MRLLYLSLLLLLLVAPFAFALDADGDGVPNEDDFCSGTQPDGITNERPGHHYWDGYTFRTNDGRSIDSRFTIFDTKGCSCTQILQQRRGSKRYELLNGCTAVTLDKWAKKNRVTVLTGAVVSASRGNPLSVIVAMIGVLLVAVVMLYNTRK